MANIRIFILLTTVLLAYNTFGQTPVDVADNTLKISPLSEEIFYYGFAEGNQLIFSFSEENSKELKEIEITELPSSSKFMDFKSKKIENKTIQITKNSIYKFRFTNGAIVGRICKFKIQRIPASNTTKNFNTNVYWRTVYDTTYVTEEERYLQKTDTIISNLTDQNVKVHSQTNGNKTVTNFELPQNTVAWSYYIDVDQAGQQAFKNATENLTKSASPLVSKIPQFGPMAMLALGGTSYLVQVQGKESVDYALVDGANAELFNSGQEYHYIRTGKVVNDFSRMTTPLRGQYYFCLVNQNMFVAIDVSIKVTAIIVNNEWGTRQVQKMHILSRQEAYLSGQ